jgi:ankyrin repeat protein
MNSMRPFHRLISIGVVLVVAALLLVEAGRMRSPVQRAGLADDPLLDALVHAILENDASGVERALAAGADPNGRDVFGQPPLIHVARKQDPRSAAMAWMLLDHGADADAVTALSLTPLLNAVGCDNYAVAKLLLERGANPGATAELPAALDYAIRLEASEDVMSLLRDAGADAHTRARR